MCIYEMTPQNIQYFKSPASFENCLSRMGNVPYWHVIDRICYHVHETPMYIICNNVFISSNYSYLFDDYLHVANGKKPIYSISYYTLHDLETICNRLHLPTGKKRDMYDSITSIFKKN
jgi:hypothetical protein